MIPVANGIYSGYGYYQGVPYYRRGEDNWFLWWRAGSVEWCITPELGVLSLDDRWCRIDPNILGQYNPEVGAQGIAYVTNA